MQVKNQYFDYSIDPSFLIVYEFFVLLFESKAVSRGHTGYYLSTAKMKDYSVIIDGRKFFDQPVRNNIRTYKAS